MNEESLMRSRIRKILMICSNYDSFTLEADGRIESQTLSEYRELNLSNPPKFIWANSSAQARRILESEGGIDMVMCMYNEQDQEVFSFSSELRARGSSIPFILLIHYSKAVRQKVFEKDISGLDYVFSWHGNADLILAIVKLIEDAANAENDVFEVGVKVILLVEDSVRYYSTYLPELYKLVLTQSREFLKESMNEDQTRYRKRSRPKILLATCYEDAVAIFNKYKKNLLGVISDVGMVVHKGDKSKDEKLDAGLDLVRMIREYDPMMPVLLQSSQGSIQNVADGLGVGFLKKFSRTLFLQLGDFMKEEFGFGDFVFKDSSGKECGRASSLSQLVDIIDGIPDEVLLSNTSRNMFSKWLYARGLFNLAEQFRAEHHTDAREFKKFLLQRINAYHKVIGQGIIAEFRKDSYQDYYWFSRMGEGSLGGKARGLAFLNHLVQKYSLSDKYEGLEISIPRTVTLTTDWFDRFILDNGLQYVINSDISDEEILSEFVSATLPQGLMEHLRIFVKHVRRPLAIRSSSKLEDSYYQPFAGVYSTYMIPHTENEDQELRLLGKAIKSVYASVYFAASRSYIAATGNVISEEKMAIIVQEICGSEDRGYFFPTLSGVARSLNFYPVGHEKPEEGIVKLAFGLGKAVVDGEQVLRFSPVYPSNVLQTSTPELVMSDTQKAMYALNLQPEKFKTSIDDAVNLEHIDIADCAGFRSLRYAASTWDVENMRIVDSAVPQGPKFITFSHILKYGVFPLADIIRRLLEIAQDEMKCCVEIEFAADLDHPGSDTAIFNVLQIRPISIDSRNAEVDWSKIDTDGALISSSSALGTGWTEGVSDIIYLRRDTFDPLRTAEMAQEITALNAALRSEGRGYVLIGYGRWGSTIPSLGVPVRWGDISEVKAIVECSLENFRIDPSQGSHFFQNMTSFNVGYINVDPFSRGDWLDYDALEALPALHENKYLRHVRLETPLRICIDGRKNKAIVKL